MDPAGWSQYWLGHGWVQFACLFGPVAIFCVVRLVPRPFAGIDYAVHFQGAHSTRDAALSLPPRRPVPVHYRASIRLMNTGRTDILQSELIAGVVITVRPVPTILIAMVASACVPRGTLTLEPVDPARVAVEADLLRPGDWVDVDLLTDRPITVDGVSAPFVGPRRTRAPRRRRLRRFDPTQLAVDLIGLPVAVGAAAVVGAALPPIPATVLDVAAGFAWWLLAAWAVLSLWGLMDQSVRFTNRRRWPGHPRVFLRWGDPPLRASRRSFSALMGEPGPDG